MTANTISWEGCGGKTLGNEWTLDECPEPLGAGGGSLVMPVRKGRLCGAAKILSDDGRSEPELLSRFNVEFDVLASRAHRNIVSVYDRGELEAGLPFAQGAPFFVMQRLQGATLRTVLEAALDRQGRTAADAPGPPYVTAANAFLILESVGRALDFLHGDREEAVVHGDLKPANIFLHTGSDAPDGEIKLLDFGIASVLDDGGRPSHISNKILGSWLYMCPECAQGAVPTIQFDLYAFAVLAYELLTLRWPWTQSLHKPSDVCKAHQRPPVTPSQWPWSRWLAQDKRIDEILLRGLSTDPARRPTHVGEILDGLRGLPDLDDGSARRRPESVVDTDHGLAALVRGRGAGLPMRGRDSGARRRPLVSLAMALPVDGGEARRGPSPEASLSGQAVEDGAASEAPPPVERSHATGAQRAIDSGTRPWVRGVASGAVGVAAVLGVGLGVRAAGSAPPRPGPPRSEVVEAVAPRLAAPPSPAEVLAAPRPTEFLSSVAFDSGSAAAPPPPASAAHPAGRPAARPKASSVRAPERNAGLQKTPDALFDEVFFHAVDAKPTRDAATKAPSGVAAPARSAASVMRRP